MESINITSHKKETFKQYTITHWHSNTTEAILRKKNIKYSENTEKCKMNKYWHIQHKQDTQSFIYYTYKSRLQFRFLLFTNGSCKCVSDKQQNWFTHTHTKKNVQVQINISESAVLESWGGWLASWGTFPTQEQRGNINTNDNNNKKGTYFILWDYEFQSPD